MISLIRELEEVWEINALDLLSIGDRSGLQTDIQKQQKNTACPMEEASPTNGIPTQLIGHRNTLLSN